MKKQVLLFLFLLFIEIAWAQIPAGYYNGTAGLTGYALKTKLSQITGQGYNSQSYNALWSFFAQHDLDVYYENDGTILDIYSENPSATDPYDYVASSDQCGNYAQEGDCYNREHLMPKSWFSDAAPMVTDVHHIYPTDGYVNGRHGHLPLGEVAAPSYVSDIGCKKGPNAYNFTGAYTGAVFEPTDEFKGDIARAYFYMAMRYENQISGWEHANVGSEHTFNGTSTQVFDDWMLNMLLEWHEMDPVSQREIDRNNAAYQFQGNRNPFIDHPEFVGLIWGPSTTEQNLIMEDFDDCTNLDFVAVSELSAEDWTCISSHGVNNSGAMQMNSYVNGQQVPSKDWLITANPIDFDHYTTERLSFFAEATFGATPLKLLYSVDYDGNGNPSHYTWQPVPNLSIPVYNGSGNPIEHYFTEVDVSGIQGSQVYLGFKYDNANGAAATRWTIDNVKLTGLVDLGVSQQNKLNFSLYPNPATHYITLELPRSSGFEYFVYDLNGRLLKQGRSTQSQQRIITTDLPEGMYLIRVLQESTSVTKQLIIK